MQPKLDVVAVMTGVLKDDEDFPIPRLIDDIAGAIKSDASLPPDSAAQSSLAASIQRAATEQATPVGPTPELAKTISGKSYRLSENDLRDEDVFFGPRRSQSVLGNHDRYTKAGPADGPVRGIHRP